MNLFQNLSDLKPFIFRITDNGGKTCDRFTIITCDGDYFGSSESPSHPQGFGQWGEGIDVRRVAEGVEGGNERDLRWIDLPESVRACVMTGLNRSFEDWLDSFAPPVQRADVVDHGSGYKLSDRFGEGVYGRLGAYYLRIENYPEKGIPENDYGPFKTLREAVLATLPEDYNLSGPEYFASVDLWDETGGPAPLWDCDSDKEAGL